MQATSARKGHKVIYNLQDLQRIAESLNHMPQQDAPVAVLRDCLEFVSDRQPISVDEVEPAAAIMERFCTGGMSLGAISREVRGSRGVYLDMSSSWQVEFERTGGTCLGHVGA